MLNRQPRVRTAVCRVVLAFVVLAIIPSGAKAAWPINVPPLLAEEGGEGYAILDWAIVVVLIGLTLFVICRTGRRN